MDARVKGTLPSALSPAEASAAVDFAFDVFDFALDPGPDSACPHNEITSSICTDATTSFSPMTPSTPSLDKFVIPKDGFIVALCHPEATASSSLRDLGEPRDASRSLRRNNSRVWLASILHSPDRTAPPQTQKPPPTTRSEGAKSATSAITKLFPPPKSKSTQ